MSSACADRTHNRSDKLGDWRGCAAGAISSFCIAITPISASGECFTKEYPATIEYQYQTEIMSPMTGFIVWDPRLGAIYRPIVIEQKSSEPDQYLMNKEQTGRVVAYVSNEPLWSRYRLANRDHAFSMRTYGSVAKMVGWQHHMREKEDFIFTVQQGQNIPVRRRSENISQIAERADKLSMVNNSDIDKFPPEVAVDTKRWSVQLRNHYSDYMRAYELPKLVDAAEHAMDAATLRRRIAKGDLDQGMMTCPIACVVMLAHVVKGQRVNAGDRIATVASIHNKKATISLPVNHIALHLNPQDAVYRVAVKQERPALSISSIGALPDTIDNPPITLKGKIGSLPVRREQGTMATIELILSDESNNARLLSTIGANTSITLAPEEYASASPDEQRQLEGKISKVGLTCQ